MPRSLRVPLILLLFWLFFECTVSWLATCDPSYQGEAKSGHEEGRCTLFEGPLASLILFSVRKTWSFLETNERQLSAAFTIVLAVSTIGLWLSTRRVWAATVDLAAFAEQQARDMKASVKAAEKAAQAAEKSAATADKALHATERAFVFLKNLKMERVLENRVELRGYLVAIKVAPEWENSGATPTKRALCHTSWRAFAQGDSPKSIGFEDQWDPDANRTSTRIFLAPKSVAAGPIVRITREELLSGRAHFVWGWVEYDDIFDIRHRTEFCVEVLTASGPIGGPEWLSHKYDRLHNGSDEECYRPPSPYQQP